MKNVAEGLVEALMKPDAVNARADYATHAASASTEVKHGEWSVPCRETCIDVEKDKIEQAVPEVAHKAPEAEGRGGKGEAAASPNFGKSAENVDEAMRSTVAYSSTLLSLSPAPQPASRSKRRLPPCQNLVRL